MNSIQQIIQQNVSLVCTVYNESSTINIFLGSILKMSVFPSEFVIVDGNSSDDTVRKISDFIERNLPKTEKWKLIVSEEANKKRCKGPVGKGRNIAIANCSNTFIATTDAGCIIDKYWLENLILPFTFDTNISAVSGWYIPEKNNFFQMLLADFWFYPKPAEGDQSFMPSSRSFAFKKDAWEKVGGYPEYTLTAEDTIFVLKLKEKKYKFFFTEKAFVKWKLPSNLTQFIKVTYRYGFGDGYTSIMLKNLLRNFIKVTMAIFLGVLGIIYSKWSFFVFFVYYFILLFRKRKIIYKSLPTLLRFPITALLKFMSDSVYILGYLSGRIKKMVEIK